MNTTAPATKTSARCECSRFSVLVNVHDTAEGGLAWDSEYGTHCISATNNTFAPGHDAKLKSFLIKAGANSHEVTKDEGGVNRISDAMTFATEYGFAYMVSQGIAAAKDKLMKQAEAAARKHERAEEREARKLAKANRTPKTKKPVEIVEVEGYRFHAAPVADGTLTTRKVGRWDYEGILGMHRVEGGEKADTIEVFRYQDKSGKVLFTTKSR